MPCTMSISVELPQMLSSILTTHNDEVDINAVYVANGFDAESSKQ